MSRKYLVQATMLHDKYSDKVVQPTLNHVEQLHKLLDMIPNDTHALAIDMIIADLIRFAHPPQNTFMPEILPPKQVFNNGSEE